MTLIQSWIDSLTLLKPKNAQLFIMVTIKSVIEAYKLLFYYWWWVIVLMIACYIVPIVFPTLGQDHIKIELLDTSRWLYQVFLFATCLATRPSTMKKDCAYFRSHAYTFSIILLLAFIPKTFWPTPFSPLYIFLVLFFLDSGHMPSDFLRSLWNSLKMIIYNLPLLIIMGICFNLPVWFYYRLPIWLVPTFFNLCAAVLAPIGVCFYANIYIKKLHDQFDLYFQSP